MADPAAAARRVYRRGREGLAVKARRQAWAELLARHDDEFRALVNEKRAALGLPPARRGRPSNNSAANITLL